MAEYYKNLKAKRTQIMVPVYYELNETFIKMNSIVRNESYKQMSAIKKNKIYTC